jgi:hypothetical protein
VLRAFFERKKKTKPASQRDRFSHKNSIARSSSSVYRRETTLSHPQITGIMANTTTPSFTKHQTTKNEDKKRKSPAISISSEATSLLTKTSASALLKKQKQYDDTLHGDDGEHDLTTPEGQMAMNPKMTAKASVTEARREYNRRNAARGRKRNKIMVSGLQDKVDSLTKRIEYLQKSEVVLQAQLGVLQTQHVDLLVSCSRRTERIKAQAQSSNGVMLQLIEQLQRRSQAQQQVQTFSQLLNTPNGLFVGFRAD